MFSALQHQSRDSPGILCYAFQGAGIMCIKEQAKDLIMLHLNCRILAGINNITAMERPARLIGLRITDS